MLRDDQVSQQYCQVIKITMHTAGGNQKYNNKNNASQLLDSGKQPQVYKKQNYTKHDVSPNSK